MDKGYETLDNISNLNDEALALLANKIAIHIADIFRNIETSIETNTPNQSIQNVAGESDISTYPAAVTTLEPEIKLEKDKDNKKCTKCTCEKCKMQQIYPTVGVLPYVGGAGSDNTSGKDYEDFSDYYEENIDSAKLYFHLLKVYEGKNIQIKRGGKQNILFVDEVNEMNTGAINVTVGNKNIILPLNEDGSVTFALELNNVITELQFKLEQAANEQDILILAV